MYPDHITTIMSIQSGAPNNTNLSDTSGEDYDLEGIPEYEASLVIWRYCPPVLLLLGGLGNVATIFVLRRMDWGQSTQHVFLTALAVVDLGLLYVGLLRQWIFYTFDIEVRNLHVVLCKGHPWVVYSLGNSSAWLLTAVTVQRAMSVIWPYRISSLCTRRNSTITVLIIIFLSWALHAQNLYVMRLDDHDDCVVAEELDEFDVVWQWVDLLVASIVPSTVLLFCNAFLAVTLFRSAREALNLGSTRGSSSENPSSSCSSSETLARKKLARSLTIMLMLLSVTFLLLTLPVCVFLLWQRYLLYTILDSTLGAAKMYLAWAIVNILWYSNSAVNFLLYCVSGTKFRNEFLTLITCSRLGVTGRRSRHSRKHSLSNGTTIDASRTSVSTVEMTKL